MITLPEGDFPTTQSKKLSESSLYEGLRQYAGEGFYPFHMPGHKGNIRFLDSLSPAFDLTEIDGLDNLHQPRGLIEAAQKKAALLFGAEESFFLVNGATAGVMAALCAVSPGGDILTARNSHRSFYSGLIFSGARASYLYPPITKEGLQGGILPQDIEEALRANENIQAVFITSPTYEGFSSNLKKIAETVHRYDKMLIVDEAHGAHFTFHPIFPTGALTAGADIVIQSLHKTLPALTQSAILHVQGKRADRTRLRELLSMLQTSSPSYILMASISRCVDLLESEAKALFQNYCQMLTDFRESFNGRGRIRLLGRELTGSFGIETIDPGKLVFITETGLTGNELSERLRSYRLQVEMHGPRHVLAMTGICDTAEGFEMLKNAIEDIASIETYGGSAPEGRLTSCRVLPVITARQAFYAEKKSVLLTESSGCIAGEFIIPYPPGVPLMAPGELITDESIEIARACHKAGISLVGHKEDGCIQIVKE